jgi:uncharacterized membrane protein
LRRLDRLPGCRPDPRRRAPQYRERAIRVTAHLRSLLTDLGDTFWLPPGFVVIVGVLSGVGLVAVDGSGIVPPWLIASPWLYNGGATGARTLLGAVASSTIGVAGTVFSITIAALSLAAGQMGPRLLRNFTRDRGNQLTLGTFLGTFSYSLMVCAACGRKARGYLSRIWRLGLCRKNGVCAVSVFCGSLAYCRWVLSRSAKIVRKQ